jgi:flagellar hook-length control protein FliK
MAAILSPGASAPNPGATIQPATNTGGTSAAPTQGTSGSAPDSFTQLIAQLLGGGTGSSAQGTADPLQDLAGLAVGGDGVELQGDDRDSDTDGTDDDEAGALAIAALLPGLTGLTPTSANSTASAGATAGSDTASAIGALIAKGADVDASQAAINELTGDAKAEATDTAGGAARNDTTAASSAQNTNSTPSTQIHALMTAHTAAGDVDVNPDATLRNPVGTHAWKDELGTQLTWMALNGREAASLRLSPEHLGPLEVRISMREGEASVYFGASNPDTRSALEQSLPRLRELFASNGLVLADAGVSRDAPRNAFKPSPQSPMTRGVSDASSEASVKSITLARAGLIDTYV